MKNYFFALLFCFAVSLTAQVSYNGNGNSGFGGVIGTGTLVINDDGTTITMEVTRGSGDFNDAMVLYLDTTPGGRASIDGDVNDQADALRRAISSAGDFASVLTFPVGFEPDYAVAVDVNFGGLWSIPPSGPVGDGELPFVTSMNSTLMATTDASFTMDVDWTELGLTSGDSFDFIGIYLNPGNGFTSNESFGSPISTGNVADADLEFTGFFTYSNTLGTDNELLSNVKIVTNNKQINVLGLNKEISLEVYNMLGQNVYNRESIFVSDNQTIELNNINTGMYLLRIGHNGTTKTFKILLD